MDDNAKLKFVFDDAYWYLCDSLGKETVEKQLEYYYHNKPTTFNRVFERMIESLKNKAGHKNYIAEIKEMEEILIGFDHYKVYEQYGKNWEGLFAVFKEKFGVKYTTMDVNNKRNAWVIFTKGVISCAKFLSNFKSLEDFYTFIQSFFYNEYTIAALPMLLDAEIFDMGFPLACDFLKEIGFVQYGKPDIHLKDIFIALNLVDNNSDYETFKIIVKIGLIVHKDPVIIDKIFWLIGYNRLKEKFIGYMKMRLDK